MYKDILETVDYEFYHWLALGGRELYREASGRGPVESEVSEWFLESGQELHASLCYSRSS